ncbi:MAG: phosphoribosylanthranilate isomerase [Pseudomonadota bacterium]
MQTRTKICGITNIEDGLFAIDCGADALGFVFYPPSPRNISVQDAAEIIKQLPPFVTMVGLFVDESRDVIEQTINQTQIDLLQFHGNEDEAFCQQFSFPYIKAIRMKDGLDIQQLIEDYSSARAILLDSYVAGIPGGTGEAFNWELIPAQTSKAIILAGGLTPENVAEAINIVKPFAVDVSGGVEKSKGIKDHKKIQDFIKSTRVYL